MSEQGTMSAGTLRLSRLPSGEPEIFTSLQGEGATCGLPSVFVRLALCNLRCSWCDTRYTWDWAHYEIAAETMEMSTEEVARRVAESSVRNVVVTGGEPLLQGRQLIPLVQDLAARGRRIEVETNGTIAPSGLLLELVDQWNVSPKLANSSNPLGARRRSEALGVFAALPTAYFKFVVVDPHDLDEVALLQGQLGLGPDRILLMPEAQDAATLAKRSDWVAEQCRNAGYRFSPRLQVAFWGNARGR